MAGKVIINQGNVKKLTHNGIIAMKQAADATLTDILQAQVIPFDQGTMQNDQTFVDESGAASGSVSIVTSSPQATRLYFHPEYNFQSVNNPNAQGAWFDDWIGGSKSDFATKAFAKLYKSMNGGVT